MKKEIKKVLEDLEKESRLKGNPYWIISHETGEFLNKLIREKGLKRVLEVGTSVGYSGIWMAEALSHTKGLLYSIESHEGRYKMATVNFKKAGLTEYVVQLKGHAPDIHIPDMFDLLFLDATKAEHVSYLVAFMFHMKKGGIIITDNALSHAHELEKYREYIFSNKQLKSHIEEIGTGLYISEIV